MIVYFCMETHAEKYPRRGGCLPDSLTGLPEFIEREVMLMTAYETITVLLSVIGTLISLGMLIIALLNFLNKRKNQK